MIRTRGARRVFRDGLVLDCSLSGCTPHKITHRVAVIPMVIYRSSSAARRARSSGADREPVNPERLRPSARGADLEAVAQRGRPGPLRQVPVPDQPGEHGEDVHLPGMLAPACQLPDKLRAELAQVPPLHRYATGAAEGRGGFQRVAPGPQSREIVLDHYLVFPVVQPD